MKVVASGASRGRVAESMEECADMVNPDSSLSNLNQIQSVTIIKDPMIVAKKKILSVFEKLLIR